MTSSQRMAFSNGDGRGGATGEWLADREGNFGSKSHPDCDDTKAKNQQRFPQAVLNNNDRRKAWANHANHLPWRRAKDSLIQNRLGGTIHWFKATQAKALGLIQEVILNFDTNAAIAKKAPAIAQDPTQLTNITAAQIESQWRGVRLSWEKFAQSEGVPELIAQSFSNRACSVEEVIAVVTMVSHP